MCNLKKNQNKGPYLQNSHICRNQTYGFQGRKWGGIDWESGIDTYTLLYRK